MAIKPFKRVYHIGAVDYGRARIGVTVCAELREGGELSITSAGNGNLRGQWAEPLTDSSLEPASGWSKAKARRLAAIWEDWHLNHLRAYDSAMARDGWHKRAAEPMLGYRFSLDSATCTARQALERQSLESLKAGEPVQLSEEAQALLALPYEVESWIREGEPVPAAPPRYVLAKAGTWRSNPERKTLGWLRPSEHCDGLLGRVHPDSGNAYGSQWYREDLPAEVIAELLAFPAAQKPVRCFKWLGEPVEAAIAAAHGKPSHLVEALARYEGEKAWRDGTWQAVCPYHEGGAAARIWEAAKAWKAKESADVL